VGKVAVLLDTHIFLWWLFDDSQLPGGIRATIECLDNTILISSASVWEITTKFRLGKLPEASDIARNVPLWIEKAGFQAISVNPDHAQLAGEWKIPHRDPFDRMLAAQAKLENIALATIDRTLSDFPIHIMNS
jgi:PIN domain nuclease of toxin-antitoxin system